MRTKARNRAALTAGVAALLLALLGVRVLSAERPSGSPAGVGTASRAAPAAPRYRPAAQPGARRIRAARSRLVSSIAERASAEKRANAQAQALPVEPIESSDEVEVPLVGPASLFLFSLARGVGEPLASARGFDRRSPRDLTLWRVDAASGRSAPVARGASEPDGSVHFDRLLVPTSGVRLVATAAGRSPDDPGASSPLELEPSRPGPPPTRVASIASGRWHLRAYTVPGAVLLVDGGGEGPPRRFPPAPAGGGALPAARGVEVEVAAPSAGLVRVAQQLADGSVTAWRPVPPPLGRMGTQ